jgi:hypothetical protein
MCNKSMWAICFLCLSVISIAEGQQPQIPDRVVKKIEAQGKNNLLLTESDLQKEIVLTVLTGKIGDPLPQELAACLKPNQPLIIHFATWTSENADGPYELKTSNWYVYHGAKRGDICRLHQATMKADEQPLLYGDSQDALLLGINTFTKPVAVSILYKVSNTPKKPDNVQNLGMLLSGLAGITTKGGAANPETFQFYRAVGTIPAYKRLPFEFNIGFSLTPLAKAADTIAAAVSPQSAPISMEDGYVGKPYAKRISEPGQRFRIPEGGGKLPIGLSLAPDGTVSGTPEKAGEIMFSVEITDNAPAPSTTTVRYKIRIVPQMESAAGGAPKPQKDDPATKPKTGTPTSPASDAPASQSTSQDTNPIDCTAASEKSPCVMSRSFRSDDKEWWDVGLAITIPGVKEAQFSLDKNNVIQRTETTHTNIYAMFDIYLLAYWKSKESAWPHLNAGLPVTGKTFYRPYFGAAENLTRLTHIDRYGFPVRIDFFAGIVYMKEFQLTQFNVGDSVLPSKFGPALKPTRVIKPIFGIEVPVGALISKIGKSGK